jgi:flavin reductase (DIM6/NTAB) family NADH-FMN oxidoreductase RutF
LESASFSIDPQIMRNAMCHWATGVTVVSSIYKGVQHGMTVSSFTSVELEPPLLMVSLSRETRTHGLVENSGVFGVTILREDQQAISDRFAGRVADGADRFTGLQTIVLSTGAPFLAGGLAFFDCKVVATYLVGGHTLFVGEVIAIQTVQDGAPLIYYNRGYHHLAT